MWSIEKVKTIEMIGKFLQAIEDKCIAIKPNWVPKCFIINYTNAGVVALKDVFLDIPIYLCSWHIQSYAFIIVSFVCMLSILGDVFKYLIM
jgi:hypothetical protein